MRRLFLTLLFGYIALSSVVRAGELPSFQALVDALEEGETLSPPAGVYAGPVIVSDPDESRQRSNGRPSFEF